MERISTIGIDIAKNVFQVHGIDTTGQTVLCRRLRRTQVVAFFAELPPCLVGMEACGTSHYWARTLQKLGHTVKLMPPAYVKPYVKRNKTDAADAEAICEAVIRPSMRFVPVKSAGQQSALLLHRTRDLLIRQRTMLVNALRAHMAEFGIVAPQGIRNVRKLFEIIDGADERLPTLVRRILSRLFSQLAALTKEIIGLEKQIKAWHLDHQVSRRLTSVPGVGPITASAIAATAVDPGSFTSARDFAAWLGLTPRQNSSGGKERRGGISKRGDRYIRRLLVIGAMSVIRSARAKADSGSDWLSRLLQRRPTKVAALALANKMARIIWALLAKKETYCTLPTT